LQTILWCFCSPIPTQPAAVPFAETPLTDLKLMTLGAAPAAASSTPQGLPD